jgi:ComF family protein
VRAIDVLLPPQCLACRAIVAHPGLLCPRCFGDAHRLAPPLCRTCGTTLLGAIGVAGLTDIDLSCGACLSDPPRFARARAVFAYDDVAGRLIHDFKYRDRLEGRAAYGEWLAQAGADFIAEADLIVPVPLHYWRLVRRRYNQAALLGSALAKAANKPLVVDALRRIRPTRSQTGLSAEDRARNVRGAFAVRRAREDAVMGAQIVLVDDVLTTGATANACARALQRAGVKEVSVVTLARVTQPG